MRTFRAILVTMIITVVIGAIGIGSFLLNEGIVTIQKRDVNHTKTVMIDGVVTEQTNWSELMGYEFKIDVVDSAYIGK